MVPAITDRGHMIATAPGTARTNPYAPARTTQDRGPARIVEPEPVMRPSAAVARTVRTAVRGGSGAAGPVAPATAHRVAATAVGTAADPVPPRSGAAGRHAKEPGVTARVVTTAGGTPPAQRDVAGSSATAAGEASPVVGLRADGADLVAGAATRAPGGPIGPTAARPTVGAPAAGPVTTPGIAARRVARGARAPGGAAARPAVRIAVAGPAIEMRATHQAAGALAARGASAPGRRDPVRVAATGLMIVARAAMSAAPLTRGGTDRVETNAVRGALAERVAASDRTGQAAAATPVATRTGAAAVVRDGATTARAAVTHPAAATAGAPATLEVRVGVTIAEARGRPTATIGATPGEAPATPTVAREAEVLVNARTAVGSRHRVVQATGPTTAGVSAAPVAGTGVRIVAVRATLAVDTRTAVASPPRGAETSGGIEAATRVAGTSARTAGPTADRAAGTPVAIGMLPGTLAVAPVERIAGGTPAREVENPVMIAQAPAVDPVERIAEVSPVRAERIGVRIAKGSPPRAVRKRATIAEVAIPMVATRARIAAGSPARGLETPGMIEAPLRTGRRGPDDRRRPGATATEIGTGRGTTVPGVAAHPPGVTRTVGRPPGAHPTGPARPVGAPTAGRVAGPVPAARPRVCPSGTSRSHH